MDRKIPLEAFEKVDEASVDGEHNVNITLFKKPLIPTRPTEETETYSVISKADHIEDLESPVDETDEVAKISPRAEIEDHEGNVINKKTETILRVKIRNKINMKRVERMTQRKRMSLTKVWKMLIVWKLFKRILQVVTVKSVK